MPGDRSAAIAERDALGAALRANDTPATAAEVAGRIRALERVLGELRSGDDSARRRTLALTAVNGSVARLGALGRPADLIEAAPEELCRSCGFSRAMISRVRRSLWMPQAQHTTPEAPDARAFADYVADASREIPLEHMLMETDMVRRRIAVLVADAHTDPRTFKEIIGVAGVRSYVAAPIMPARRVIGFLHADRRGQPRAVDATDRDNLWAFAEHFGLLFERAVLIERLERQRLRIRTALAEAADAVDLLHDEELALARHEPPPDPRPSAGTAAGRPGALALLLSEREREVLDLVASGATNVAVAEQLVISTGTVKSHMKRILRKLHVTNRAEAVARYVQLLRRETGPPEDLRSP